MCIGSSCSRCYMYVGGRLNLLKDWSFYFDWSFEFINCIDWSKKRENERKYNNKRKKVQNKKLWKSFQKRWEDLTQFLALVRNKIGLRAASSCTEVKKCETWQIAARSMTMGLGYSATFRAQQTIFLTTLWINLQHHNILCECYWKFGFKRLPTGLFLQYTIFEPSARLCHICSHCADGYEASKQLKIPD